MSSRMLASVSNVNEAEIVLNAGVDIIDIKDPGKGALGAVRHSIVNDIVNKIAGRCLTSATIGDLPMHAEHIAGAISAMAETGVDIVKVGVFSETLPTEVLSAITRQAENNIDIVMVFFADKNPTLGSITMLDNACIMGVMLDTANKNNGSLTSVMNDTTLRQFIECAHSAGLKAGLAGALRGNDVAQLLKLEPDYLGFRGALCRQHQRENTIDVMAVRRIRAMIPDCSIPDVRNDMLSVSAN
ncbi:MAG: (5-formylfuran-3-yl)methyl phosphate synthase [Gammaproteobacteria bacterium]